MIEFALGFVGGMATFLALALVVRARRRRQEARLQSAWGAVDGGAVERQALLAVLGAAEMLPTEMLTTPLYELKERLLVLEGVCGAARMVIAREPG